MLTIHVSFLGVILSSLAYMILGTLWYSNTMFAQPWMKLIGKKMEDLKPNPMNYVWIFIAAFITSFVTSEILYLANITTIDTAIYLAIMIWIGFTATRALTNDIFEGRPMKLFLINNGYHLVTLLASVIILVLIK